MEKGVRMVSNVSADPQAGHGHGVDRDGSKMGSIISKSVLEREYKHFSRGAGRSSGSSGAAPCFVPGNVSPPGTSEGARI